MKGIIKNITDVITNSSSEVFVMNKDEALYYNNLENTNGCITIEKINWDWIECNGYYEQSLIIDICNIKLTEKDKLHQDKWGDFDSEYWHNFIQKYKSVIEKELIGLYYVEIEDHFEDAYDVTDEARSDSIWSDSRH